jgi:hypothetical protein
LTFIEKKSTGKTRQDKEISFLEKQHGIGKRCQREKRVATECEEETATNKIVPDYLPRRHNRTSEFKMVPRLPTTHNFVLGSSVINYFYQWKLRMSTMHKA